MSYNVKPERPNELQFSHYLQEILGGSYTVIWNPNGGYYQITQDDGSGSKMTENLRINIREAFPTHFSSTYGGRFPGGVPEIAPELLTKNQGYALTSSPMLHTAPVVTKPAKGQWQKADVQFRHQMVGATRNLANWIHGGFSSAREEVARGQADVDVLSHIIGVATAGSSSYADPTAEGSLMNPVTNIANRIKSAESFSWMFQALPKSATNIAEMELKRRAREDVIGQIQRRETIQSRDIVGTDRLLSLGYIPDRSNENRFVSVGRGSRLVQSVAAGIMEEEVYVPSPSILKHMTITERAREQGVLFGPGNIPLTATPIPEMGEGKQVGYRQSTAVNRGRIPEQGLLQNVLLSTQYAVPGSGAFYPEHFSEDITGIGFNKPIETELTTDIRGLIAGQIDFRRNPRIRPGAEFKSAQKFALGSMGTRNIIEKIAAWKQAGSEGAKPAYIPLQQDLGAANYVVEGQRMIVPEYMNVGTGLGAKADTEMLRMGAIRKITPEEIAGLEKRFKMPVIPDPIRTTVTHALSGFTRVNAKYAGGGVKTGEDPFSATPSVSTRALYKEGFINRDIPITTQTWEAKAVPEMMAAALGALPAGAQEQLLKEYSQSLEATGDTGQSQIIAGAVRELAAARRNPPQNVPYQEPKLRIGQPETTFEMETRIGGPGGPFDAGTKLDVAALAKAMNMPDLEMAKDIYERVILGQSIKEMGKMSQRELEEFAMGQMNQRNLQRYGIGLVAGKMTAPVTERYHRSEFDFWKEQAVMAYMDMSKSGDIPKLKDVKAAEDLFFKQTGFERPTPDQQRVTRTYRPEGFLFPGFGGTSIEHPGGGVLGREELEILNQIAPKFAQRIGASQLDITGAGAMTRLDAIRNPVRWASAQAASLAMISASRSAQEFEIPEAIKITKSLAAEIARSDEAMSLLDPVNANMAGLQEFSKIFKQIVQRHDPSIDPDTILSAPIKFGKGRGGYVQSLEATRMLGTEATATMTDARYTGEDQARIWNMTQSAWRSSIEQLINPRSFAAKQKAGEDRGKLSSYFMSTYGLPSGEKRQSVKNLFASDVQATKSRYSYWSELGQEEVFATKEMIQGMIRREAKSSGIELTDAQVAEVYGSMHDPKGPFAEGVPMYMLRYPQLGGEGSAFVANLLTPEHMARMGRQTPTDITRLQSQSFRMGMPLSSILGGDFDWDPMMALLGLSVKKDQDTGKVGWSFASVKDDRTGIEGEIQEQLQKTRSMTFESVMSMFFPDPKMAKQFNPLYQTLLERGEGGLRGVAAGLIAKQFGKSDYVNYNTLIEAQAHYAGAKRHMAGTYDLDRALYAAQAASGRFSQEEMIKSRDARAAMYQPFLDLMTGVPNPMAQMLQTAYIGTDENNNALLSFARPQRSIKDKLSFVPKRQAAELTAAGAFAGVNLMAGAAASPMYRRGRVDFNTPKTLATAFSPEGSRMFKPERGVIENQQLEAEYAGIQDMIDQGKSKRKINQAYDEYYRKVSLEEAIQPVFGRELTDTYTETHKKLDISGAIMGWLGANYQDRPEMLYEAPLPQAMITKGITKEKKTDASWVPPSGFSGDIVGMRQLGLQALAQPVFDLTRGRTMGGDIATRFVNIAQGFAEQEGGLGTLMNWALGSLSDIAGFGRFNVKDDRGVAFQRAMSAPVEVRASAIPLLQGDIGYKTIGAGGRVYKPTGGDYTQTQRQAGIASVTAMLANMWGVGKTGQNELTNVLFDSEDNLNTRRGTLFEEKLGGVFQKLGYRRYSDPTAGASGMPYQGSFSYLGETDSGVRARWTASPDILRAFRTDEGEAVLSFLELKTPGEGIDRAGLDQRATAGYEQNLQAIWILNKQRQEWMRAPTQARKDKIRGHVRSEMGHYLRTGNQRTATEGEIDIGMEAWEKGRFEAYPIVAQEGGELFNLVESMSSGRLLKPENLTELQRHLRTPYTTEKGDVLAYKQAGTGMTEEMVLAQQRAYEAAEYINENRPEFLKEAGELALNARGHWVQKKNIAQQSFLPTSRETRKLDLIRQTEKRFKRVLKGAEDFIATFGGPAAGPASQNIVDDTLDIPDAEEIQDPNMVDPVQAARRTPSTASGRTIRVAQQGRGRPIFAAGGGGSRPPVTPSGTPTATPDPNQPDPNAGQQQQQQQQQQTRTLNPQQPADITPTDAMITGNAIAFNRDYQAMVNFIETGGESLRAKATSYLGQTGAIANQGSSLAQILSQFQPEQLVRLLQENPEIAKGVFAAEDLYKVASKVLGSKTKRPLWEMTVPGTEAKMKDVVATEGEIGGEIAQLAGVGGMIPRHVKEIMREQAGMGKDKDPTRVGDYESYMNKMSDAHKRYLATLDDLIVTTKDATKAKEAEIRYKEEKASLDLGLKARTAEQKAIEIGAAVETPFGVRRASELGVMTAAQQAALSSKAGMKAITEMEEAQAAEAADFGQSQMGEDQKRSGGRRIGSIMRQMMSGFGMMYAQRIFGYMFGGLDQGTDERQKLDMMTAQSAAGVIGQGQLPYGQAQRIATMRGVLGMETGGVAGAMNYLQTTPGVRDVWQGLVSGVGTFSATQWIAGMGPKDSEGNPAGWAGSLAKAAPVISGAVAVGQFMLDAYQKGKDPTGLGLRLSSQELGTQSDVWGYILASKENKDQIIRNSWENQMIRQATEAGYSWQQMSRFMEGRQGTFEQATGGFRYGITGDEWLRSVNVGETWTPEDQARWYQASIMQQIVANPNIAPEITEQAFRFAANAGLPQEQVGSIGARMQMTGVTPAIFQNLLQTTGSGLGNIYSSGRMANLWNISEGMTALDAQALQAGTAAYGQMGLAAATFSTQNMTDEMYLQEAIKLGNIAGTLPGQNYIRAVVQQQQAQQLGWFDYSTIQKPTGNEVITPVEQEQIDLNARIKQKEIDTAYAVEQALIGQGATTEQIGRIKQGMQGMNPARAAAFLSKQQQIERIVARQRFIEPERDQQYFTDYAAALRPQDIQQLAVTDQISQQASSLVTTMQQYGMPSDQIAQVAMWQAQVAAGEKTPEQFRRYYEKSSWAIGLGDAFKTTWGLSDEQAKTIRTQFTNLASWEAPKVSGPMQKIWQGVAQGDPFAMAQYYAMGNNMIAGFQVSPFQVSKDIWGPQGGPFEGMAINAAPFTVSGASNPLFPLLQAGLGQEFFQSGLGKAFAEGYQMQGTNIPPMAGMLGVQMYQMDQQWKLQQAQLAQAGAGHALQLQYLPKIWGLQDQMRDLGYEQSMWGFGRQEEGLQMQTRFQTQNWAMQQQQMDTSRLWARQDWAFQDQQRAQNWQWRTEDFQENVRFMTGRERRLAERQMGRETIQKGQEDEQIDRQRSRQQEIWAMEDQRFEAQKAQYAENIKFQEEGIAKQREFFEERFKLEKELTDLQRELQMKQLELAGANLALQKQIAEENRAAQQLQMEMQVLAMFQTTDLENKGTIGYQKMLDIFMTTEGISETMGPFFEELQKLIGYGWKSGGDGSLEPGGVSKPSISKPGGGGGKTDTTVMLNAWGNFLLSEEEDMVVGETGPERLTLRGSGIYSHKRGEIRPTLYDPWNTQQMPGSNSPAQQAGDTVIVVNVGNEELKRFVIKSVAEEV